MQEKRGGNRESIDRDVARRTLVCIEVSAGVI